MDIGKTKTQTKQSQKKQSPLFFSVQNYKRVNTRVGVDNTGQFF